MKHRFYTNCVAWPDDDVHEPGGLCDMSESARGISRRTFLRHVDPDDRKELEAALGYAPHDPGASLTMTRDWHVSYHRSKLHGRRVYFFKHSAIEYVFTLTTPTP
jgi:hypothetical protein